MLYELENGKSDINFAVPKSGTNNYFSIDNRYKQLRFPAKVKKIIQVLMQRRKD